MPVEIERALRWGVTHKAGNEMGEFMVGKMQRGTHEKPSVTALTTKHPITTSHALRPPSGSSSSIVGTAIA